MANPSKRKGTRAESLFVGLLCETYWPYGERRALNGGKDLGDTTGHPGLCFEVKAAAVLAYPEWLRETETERRNAKADFGILIVKPRQVANPRIFHALMDREYFWRLLDQIEQVKDIQADTTWLEMSTIRKMTVRDALLDANMARAKYGKKFATVSYIGSNPPFVAMYAGQMLDLLHLAGYGTDLRSVTRDPDGTSEPYGTASNKGAPDVSQV